MAAGAMLENFKRPYLSNALSDVSLCIHVYTDHTLPSNKFFQDSHTVLTFSGSTHIKFDVRIFCH